MNPLTPRIRTFFKINLYDFASAERERLMRQRARQRILGHRLTICGQLQNLKAPAVDAVGVPNPIGCVQTGTLSGVFQWLRVHARLKHLKPTPVYLGKGAWKRGRDGTDQIVDRASIASPVDAAVLGPAAAKVGSGF